MIPWQLLGSVFGGSIKDYFKSKSAIAEKKAVARIENVSKGIPGYSDEFLILVWSYPAIASFVPALQSTVVVGMANFNALPEWYVAGFMSVSFAVFGIDKLFRFKK